MPYTRKQKKRNHQVRKAQEGSHRNAARKKKLKAIRLDRIRNPNHRDKKLRRVSRRVAL